MHEVLRRKTQAVCLNCCLFFAGSGFALAFSPAKQRIVLARVRTTWLIVKAVAKFHIDFARQVPVKSAEHEAVIAEDAPVGEYRAKRETRLARNKKTNTGPPTSNRSPNSNGISP